MTICLDCVPTIRTAERRDLGAILELYVRSGLDDVALPLEQAESIFERMRHYPDYRIYVAECDGQLVGTLALLIMDNLGHSGARSGVVEDVAVSPAWRGRGIGKAMMRFAMRQVATSWRFLPTFGARMRTLFTNPWLLNAMATVFRSSREVER